jgi:hypothetical protein
MTNTDELWWQYKRERRRDQYQRDITKPTTVTTAAEFARMRGVAPYKWRAHLRKAGYRRKGHTHYIPIREQEKLWRKIYGIES